MKKVINIQTTQDGLKYFVIYEIRVKLDETNEVYTYDRYLSKKEAEDTLEFVINEHKKYTKAWIREQIVWC